MKLTSSAFDDKGDIPAKYTCTGDDVSPPLEISDIPEGTACLVLIMDDPDAPMGTWVHWVVFNIKPASSIAEDSVPGKQCMNSFGKTDYGGPCPPSGTHRYFFKLYALDTTLDIDSSSEKSDVEGAMEGHILEKTQLVGMFSK